MKTKTILFSLAALALAGCVTPATIPSESRPGVSSVNVAQRAQTCTVLAVRPVQLAAPYTNNRNSRVQTGGPQQNMGATIGGIAGILIGNELGGSTGALIGGLAGSAAGTNIGYQRDMNASYSRGLEVVVDTQRGQYVVVQGMNPSDRSLFPGQRCAITGSFGRDARVIGL